MSQSGKSGGEHLAIGTTSSTALVGDSTTISSGQASAITANTAKTGITSGQASEITANTAKTGITSGQASEITANTAKTGITSGQTSAITANTAKTGITSGQASAITANTAKATNVSTDLSLSRDGTKLDVVSSDGTNAVLPLADTDNWGVMSDEMFDEHTANTAKTGITSGQASAIAANTAKTGITSGQASAITANTAKETDVNHNVTTDLSVSRDGTKLDVVSSDGTNAVLPLADTDNWGVMSDEMFDKLDGIEAGATAEAAATTTTAGIVELATNAETTTGTDTVRAVTPAPIKMG